MSSERPWHKRFHDDALNGYMGLTLEERGAYTTFLDLMYQRGEPLVDNERLIAGWMQASLRKYRSLRDRLIELGKIFLTEDGRVSNARFEKERENALEMSRKAAENGANGGRKSVEARKNTNKNNDGRKRPLEQNSSYPEARGQIPEDRTESPEKNRNSEDIPAGAGSPSKYAFEAETIKLIPRHLEDWKRANPHIQVESELWALDDWAAELKREGRSWFHAVPKALAKKEREAFNRVNVARLAQGTDNRPSRLRPDPRI